MPASDRTSTGQFAKGKSGNIAGRPKSPTVQALREFLATDLEEILFTVREQAKSGDLSACKLILDRTVPPLKPSTNATISAFSPEAVAQGLTSGAIDTDQANKLLQTMLAAQQYAQNERLESMLADVSERLKRLESGV